MLCTKLDLSKIHLTQRQATQESYETQLILQNLYCKKILCQLQHKEEKAKPKDNISMKLTLETGLLVSCQQTEDLLAHAHENHWKLAEEKQARKEKALASRVAAAAQKAAVTERKQMREEQLAKWNGQVAEWELKVKDWPKGKQKPKHPAKPPMRVTKTTATITDGLEEIVDLDGAEGEEEEGGESEDDGDGY
ncbi:hypothetical protein BS47DRAFT_1367082 [Hydnum rufescens UP504]|uniref:Uncharacterized protein n=1 Tax=Hydnum rufescens UP504 TaxID=1448309 RepID=A0A9P6DMD8_9AGAM|nr:hypothetical protein BS47DRAFT_1367082 [Hydnum rufescens UP504]